MSDQDTKPRQCGSCEHWSGPEGEPGVRLCNWPEPPLPFWSNGIGEGSDHDNWTRATDGRRCPTWTDPVDRRAAGPVDQVRAREVEP